MTRIHRQTTIWQSKNKQKNPNQTRFSSCKKNLKIIVFLTYYKTISTSTTAHGSPLAPIEHITHHRIDSVHRQYFTRPFATLSLTRVIQPANDSIRDVNFALTPLFI